MKWLNDSRGGKDPRQVARRIVLIGLVVDLPLAIAAGQWSGVAVVLSALLAVLAA